MINEIFRLATGEEKQEITTTLLGETVKNMQFLLGKMEKLKKLVEYSESKEYQPLFVDFINYKVKDIFNEIAKHKRIEGVDPDEFNFREFTEKYVDKIEEVAILFARTGNGDLCTQLIVQYKKDEGKLWQLMQAFSQLKHEALVKDCMKKIRSL